MCAIVGALVWNVGGRAHSINEYLNEVFSRSIERGRDGRGFSVRTVDTKGERWQRDQRWPWRLEQWGQYVQFFPDVDRGSLIGNLRAEPTTEYVEDKEYGDQQPYCVGKWTIVHNGTIANDKELRTGKLSTQIDSAAIAEILDDRIDASNAAGIARQFAATMNVLKGSFAILAVHSDYPDVILTHCNYRPIWFTRRKDSFFFASAHAYLDDGHTSPQMIEPYSTWKFVAGKEPMQLATQQSSQRSKALVVCSGGLDSVVAATVTKAVGVQIELVHFMYGSRAEGPEVNAVRNVAETLQVPLRLFPIPIYKPEDSPLLQKDSTIAGGEAGAEFAHEWVPARNLVMLSIATALAEAGGFDTIVLGNNLEEAGAYPDNEPEFINRFNEVLPFAVGDGKRVRVVMPVGNMMKHEIVKLGLEIGAPLHLTWSCYRAGVQHCGTCGPCFMRRKAFEINHADEVITYACDEA